MLPAAWITPNCRALPRLPFCGIAAFLQLLDHQFSRRVSRLRQRVPPLPRTKFARCVYGLYQTPLTPIFTGFVRGLRHRRRAGGDYWTRLLDRRPAAPVCHSTTCALLRLPLVCVSTPHRLRRSPPPLVWFLYAHTFTFRLLFTRLVCQQVTERRRFVTTFTNYAPARLTACSLERCVSRTRALRQIRWCHTCRTRRTRLRQTLHYLPPDTAPAIQRAVLRADAAGYWTFVTCHIWTFKFSLLDIDAPGLVTVFFSTRRTCVQHAFS